MIHCFCSIPVCHKLCIKYTNHSYQGDTLQDCWNIGSQRVSGGLQVCTYTSPMAILDPCSPTLHVVCRHAHLALSLLADLKRTQDISVDAFLTRLLCFMRDEQALSETQQSKTPGSSSNSPEISLSDLILQVGVKVANSFCQMTGATPSTAAASTTRARNGKGYSHTLLQEL